MFLVDFGRDNSYIFFSTWLMDYFRKFHSRRKVNKATTEVLYKSVTLLMSAL